MTSLAEHKAQLLMNLQRPASVEAVAARVVWWQPPEQTLQDERLFLTYAMQYGRLEDWVVLSAYYSKAVLRKVLAEPVPGVLDARSRAAMPLLLGLQTAQAG